MAVYEGARARPAALAPRTSHVASLVTRPGARSAVRRAGATTPAAAGPRVRPAAVLTGAVLAVATLGFAYLTQTLTSTATALTIEDLRHEQEALRRIIQSREVLVVADASESLVRQRAAELGLVEIDRTLGAGAR